MAEFCQECSRLLSDYIAAVREARIVLKTAAMAAETSVIDDTGFVVADGEVEVKLAGLRRAQRAYLTHRQERHGADPEQ